MRVVSLLFVVLAISVGTGEALAREKAGGEKPAMNTEVAKAHHETAKKHFRLSNFEEALVQFKMAYKYAPLPKLLFNIAACHEGLGNLKEARDTYWLFLQKMPGTSHRSVVEARLENLTKRLEKLKKAEGQASAGVKRPEPDGIPPRDAIPAPAQEGGATSWKKVAGWTGVGAGAAALVAGVVLGVLAGQKEEEYRDGIASKQIWYEQLNVQEAGERYEAAAIGTLVAGGILAAAGAGLLIWDMLGGAEEAGGVAGVASYATGSGAGVTALVRF